MKEQAINIFIAYARKDKEYLDQMLIFLKALIRSKTVNEIWCDQEITAGEEWRKAIDHALDHADIFLLLLSSDFIASDFCYGIEMQHALKRHHEGSAKVIPILVRDCNWKFTDLAKLQMPVEGKAISSNLAIKDRLYTGIVDEIGEVALSIKTEKTLALLQANENAFWENTQKENTIAAYRKYTKAYPNGDYVKSAEAAIRTIEAQQEKERLAKWQAQEHSFWEKIKTRNTLSAYQDYLEKYQNGKYASEALNAIQEMNRKKQEAARAKDNAAWVEAQKTHTKQSYETYLSKYPNGLHQQAARTAIKKLTLLIPEMVFVKGGKDHEGRIIKDFYIGKYPVTNEEYAFFLNHYGSDTVKAGEFKGKEMVKEHKWGVQKNGKEWQAAKGYERHPMICVSWYGADEYCNWLKRETGEDCHLPAEVYWEYAARGGQQSKGYEYAGSNNIKEVAWYDENSGGRTHAVGELQPNELKLYDMSGNVWEWCADVYDKDVSRRVIRGGSWYHNDINARVSIRDWYHTINRFNDSGFRIAW